MLFVAPDGKLKSWYKISGAMKHNGKVYEAVAIDSCKIADRTKLN